LRTIVRPLWLLVVWCRRRYVLGQLCTLDNETLKDVGVYRGELWHVADAIARRVPYDPEGIRHQKQKARRGASRPGY
jgi:hypothetical protein